VTTRWDTRTVVLVSATVGLAVIAIVVATVLSGGSDDHAAARRIGYSRGSGYSRLTDVSWVDIRSGARVTFFAHAMHTDDGCTAVTRHLEQVRGHRLRVGSQIGESRTCLPSAAPQPGSDGYRGFVRHQAAVDHFFRVLRAEVSWKLDGTRLILRASRNVGSLALTMLR
jgi:hypothetical protein